MSAFAKINSSTDGDQDSPLLYIVTISSNITPISIHGFIKNLAQAETQSIVFGELAMGQPVTRSHIELNPNYVCNVDIDIKNKSFYIGVYSFDLIEFSFSYKDSKSNTNKINFICNEIATKDKQ